MWRLSGQFNCVLLGVIKMSPSPPPSLSSPPSPPLCPTSHVSAETLVHIQNISFSLEEERWDMRQCFILLGLGRTCSVKPHHGPCNFPPHQNCFACKANENAFIFMQMKWSLNKRATIEKSKLWDYCQGSSQRLDGVDLYMKFLYNETYILPLWNYFNLHLWDPWLT